MEGVHFYYLLSTISFPKLVEYYRCQQQIFLSPSLFFITIIRVDRTLHFNRSFILPTQRFHILPSTQYLPYRVVLGNVLKKDQQPHCSRIFLHYLPLSTIHNWFNNNKGKKISNQSFSFQYWQYHVIPP